MLPRGASSRLAFCSRFWGEVYSVRLTYAARDDAEAMALDADRRVSGIITDPVYEGIGHKPGRQVNAMKRNEGSTWIRR